MYAHRQQVYGKIVHVLKQPGHKATCLATRSSAADNTGLAPVIFVLDVSGAVFQQPTTY